MESLDPLYAEMLHRGFIVLRQALEAKDEPWINAEIELLHNVPSLIGEANIHRHRYFWTAERDHYMAWITNSGSAQAKSRMITYYVPLWKEMEPLVAELLSTAAPQP